TTPSTSGRTVDERSERIVAMKLDDCSSGFFCSVRVVTPIGGGPDAAGRGAPLPRVQAVAATSINVPSAAARPDCELSWKDIAPEGRSEIGARLDAVPRKVVPLVSGAKEKATRRAWPSTAPTVRD